MDVHRRRRSIGSQRALGRRERTATELDAILAGIIDRLGRRLRAAHRVCRTVVLRLRFDDFTRATRSHTLAEATGHTDTILVTARGLLVAAWPTIAERGLTLLGVSLAELHDDRFVQLALPFDTAQRAGPRPHAGHGAGPVRRAVGDQGHPARPLPRADRPPAAGLTRR